MTHTRESRSKAYAKVRQRRADWLATNGPCVSCSSSNSLEVDHIDPSQKISHNVWSWNDDRRKAELAKCQVLCKECHLRKTSEWRHSQVKHGTDTMYGKYKCRCETCRAARREAKAATRRRRKLEGLPYQ